MWREKEKKKNRREKHFYFPIENKVKQKERKFLKRKEKLFAFNFHCWDESFSIASLGEKKIVRKLFSSQCKLINERLSETQWKMGFGFDDRRRDLIMSKNPFLLPPEFYKNLFAASAILHKPNQMQNDCNKLFNAQNFPRNLLFSCGDDKEVKLTTPPGFLISFSRRLLLCLAPFIEINVL